MADPKTQALDLGDHAEDVNYSDACDDEDEMRFYQTVGHIEDILMEDAFQRLRSAFLDEHCLEFDDSETNRLEHTDVFREYTETVEKHIEEELTRRVPLFNMDHFDEELKSRKVQLDEEIVEMLATFSDFQAFKAMMLEYRSMKEGKGVDFSGDFSISKCVLQPCEPLVH